MNDRTCIVSRQRREPDELDPFRRRPRRRGRSRSQEKPARPRLLGDRRPRTCGKGGREEFVRARLQDGKSTFPRTSRHAIDRILAKSALGAVGLARKAGAVALGAAKVDNAVRSGEALLVLHATDASHDGVRKITQARRATAHLGGPEIRAYKLFSEAELGLALGGTNVIHAAVLARDAGKAAEKRMVALDRYRGGSPEDQAMFAAIADDETAAEDME